MSRYKVLGKKLHTSLDECMTALASGEHRFLKRTAPGQPQQQFDWVMRIEESVMYAVLEHLGYGSIKDLASELNRGVDRAVQYFFGNWWIGDEDDSRALDKTRPDRELAWFGVFPNGLLLGGLTGRWDDVAKICSWFDASIEAEYRGGTIEDQYMQLFLCIASSLRPEPMEGVREILANVKKCRTKRPRLLCAAWEAAINKDQKAFDKALTDSVSHFLQFDAQDVPNVNSWMALHPSIVWLIAERNGLKFPALPPNLDAAIVRRQTIGLAKDE
jgi:hypothetical protein